MKVKELRRFLKGVSSNDEIIIAIPNGKGTMLFPSFIVTKDPNLKCYKLTLGENF